MRFLVDECLSTKLPELLNAAGHDAVHIVERGLAGQPDEQVLAKAVEEDRILLSADTDFGEILSRSGDRAPSVVLFRRDNRTATAIAAVLLANIDTIAEELNRGAFSVITENRLRLRRLPLT